MADYYIDGLNGDDTTGDGSSGTPWKTIGKAIDVPLAAGDKLYVQATATYTEHINVTTRHGTMANPIVLEGFGVTVGDNVRATIDGVGGSASEEVIHVGNYWAIRNFVAENGGDNGIQPGAWSVVENCEVDSADDVGFRLTTGCIAAGCYAHDCGDEGFYFASTGLALSCIAEGCNVGFQNVAAMFGYFYSIGVGNALGQMVINSNGDSEPIINCTVDGLGVASTIGIETGANTKPSQMINCIVVACDLGVEMHLSGLTARNWAYNNCLFGNTADYNATGSTVAGEVLADPKFFDQAAKDYGPDTGSPCIAKGRDFRQNTWITMTADPIDIGALQGLGGGANFAGAFLNWGVN